MRKIHGYYRLHFCDWSHSCVWGSIIFLFHYPSLIPFLLSQHLYWLWFFAQWDDPYFQGSVLLVTLMALDYCSFSLSFVTGHRSTKKVRESPGFLTYILPCVVGTLFFLDNEDQTGSITWPCTESSSCLLVQRHGEHKVARWQSQFTVSLLCVLYWKHFSLGTKVCKPSFCLFWWGLGEKQKFSKWIVWGNRKNPPNPTLWFTDLCILEIGEMVPYTGHWFRK